MARWSSREKFHNFLGGDDHSHVAAGLAGVGSASLALRFFTGFGLGLTAGISIPAVMVTLAAIALIVWSPKIINWFQNLGNELPTPLILDLDADGVETGGLTFFDHNADGFAELSAWSSEDDGLLVIDLDGNGIIDSGAELFGDNTSVGGERAVHGFAALEHHDSNSDGVINSLDDDWNKLRVYRWSDTNNNGFFDHGEGRLETLAQHGVASLSLEHETSTTVDSSGNEHRLVGSYTKTNGKTQDLVDVWFRTAPVFSRNVGTTIPEHSETVAGLPNAAGGGQVYDLRDAMGLDDAGLLKPPFYGTGRTEQRTLAQLVAAFGTATEVSARDELLEKILHRWAGAEAASVGDYWRGSYFAFTTPQKLAVVEAFQGFKWREGQSYRHPALSASQKINLAYLNIFEGLRAQLVSQTSLKDMFDAITVMHDGEEVTSETDWGAVNPAHLTFDLSAVPDVTDAAARKSEFLRSLAALMPPNAEMLEALESVSAQWSYEYQYQSYYLAGMVSDGVTQRINEFIGDGTSNTFRTTDGGSDHLRGAGGSDVYQLGRGTGHDVVEEDFHGNNGGESAMDIVQIAPGIALSRVSLSRNVRDLVISLLGSNGQITDSLRVKDHYVNDDARIERLEIGDSARTIYTMEDFADVALAKGDGTRGSDKYDASLLPGVLGESQRGGQGFDTYLLGRGTGHEAIDEAYRNQAGSAGDAIRLKEGLALADVRLSRHGLDLKVGLVDGSGVLTDSLTVKGHYLDNARKVEFLESSDGTRLLDLRSAQSGVRLLNGAAGGILDGIGRGMANVFGVDAGSDTFRGRSGDDVYGLGLGSGADYVEEGYHNRFAGDSADTISLGAGVTSSMVRMRRTMWDLVVELVDSEGEVTDSLTVRDQFRHEWAKVERVVLDDGSTLWASTDIDALSFTGPAYRQSSNTIRGTASGGDLVGSDGVNDVFDSDAGGNDRLHGLRGDDEYRLGSGTGADEVHEGTYWLHGSVYRGSGGGDAGDFIKVDAGFGTGDVRLRRDDTHLWVELLGTAGEDGVRPVTDSLKVVEYFDRAAAKVETVEFADGTVWDSSEFHAVALRGGSGVDDIRGRDDLSDIFDSDGGGNDKLYGLRGDDEYRLGVGTGLDEIHEGSYWLHGRVHAGDGAGDAGDVIKIEAGHGTGDVRLRRDDTHLWVELLGTAGEDGVRPVTDNLKVVDYFDREVAKVEAVEFADGTVWGSSEFHAVALRGGSGADDIRGRDDMADIFDSDGGGNDRLYGLHGNDEYRLGSGTGADEVHEGAYWLHGGTYHNGGEGDAGDFIRIEAGFGTGDVCLRRDDTHLWVELLGTAGEDGARPVTDSLKVVDYFDRAAAKVETVEFADGTVWGSAEFHAVALRGGSGADDIRGRADLDDIFDSDGGGNDKLYGLRGDDEYRLGGGTGLDEVHEGSYWLHGRVHSSGGEGDAGDVIRIEAGFGTGDVRLRRDDTHLWVELLGTAGEDGTRSVTDSLKVVDYFDREVAKVETVEFADGTVWASDEFHAVALRGGSGADDIRGRADLDDIIDSDGGGNDRLYGLRGDDEYRLGGGTGLDEIHEGSYWLHGRVHSSGGAGDAGDVIKIEEGHGIGDVRLRRDDKHLWVELLGAAGEDGVRPVTDSLKVVDYFDRAVAKVETVEFADGTVWAFDEFHAVALRGGSGADDIRGRSDLDDIFDSDGGGNDKLYGLRGDDEYRLGRGTGLDEIHEGSYWLHGRVHSGDGAGDAGDVIKIEAGHGTGDVRLRRDDTHLWVELLGTAGEDGTRSVTDSLKVVDYFDREVAKVETVEFADGTVWASDEFHAVALRGGSGADDIRGRADLDDIFDSDGGGNDRLYGLRGDDEYRLGGGTGMDEIHEGSHWLHGRVHSSGGAGDDGDVIRIEASHGIGDVRLRRDDTHLWVELLGLVGEDGARSVTDSLKVVDYFDRAAAKVEAVEFADGTVWASDEFRAVALRGGSGADDIRGRNDLDDTFDSDGGGNDRLYGLRGDDKYRLGGGTGLDEVHEGNHWLHGRVHSSGGNGDAGDAIRIEAGYSTGDVRLRRDGNHLWVELLGTAGEDGVRPVTDGLKVVDHFDRAVAKVETVEFADGTVWGGDFVVGTAQGDTVTSTTASETLHGGEGDDTYVVSGEFGDDRVADSGGTDKVRVSGHTSGTLSFAREGDNMVMEVVGSDDRVTFDNWYAEGGSRKVERIEAGDKVLLSVAAERMATAMATFVTGGGTASDFVSRNHQDYWETLSGTPGS